LKQKYRLTKEVNPRVTVTFVVQGGRIVEIENPFNVRFPFSIGQPFNRGVETFAGVNGYRFERVFKEEQMSQIKELKDCLQERRFASYKEDPKVIKAKYATTCAETGQPIKKGQECVYYPRSKKCFHMDSKTAADFRSWQFDVGVLGHNY